MTADRHAPRILVVDDNAINQRLLCAQLGKLGFTAADTASSGPEAIRACDARSYALVLMDVDLGEMSGPAATRAIRKQSRDGYLPVIAITGHTGWEERQRCMDAGMDDFLSKPLRLRELARLLVCWTSPVVAAGSGEEPTGLEAGWHRLDSFERALAKPGLTAGLLSEIFEQAEARLRRLRRAIGRGANARGTRDLLVLLHISRGLGASRLTEHLTRLAAAEDCGECTDLAAVAERELKATATTLQMKVGGL